MIFGHKLHIGMPYCEKRFWSHQIPTSCLPTLLIFIHIEHTFCTCPFFVAFFSVCPSVQDIFRRIFLSNCWWQKSDIWSQASYRYPISWEAFFDPSVSYFLFAEERGYHKWALAHSSSCYTMPHVLIYSWLYMWILCSYMFLLLHYRYKIALHIPTPLEEHLSALPPLFLKFFSLISISNKL
jgi:hypothetical protein